MLICLYLAFGIAGAVYLWGTTQAGADLATYQRAGHDLWTTGDPYATRPRCPGRLRVPLPTVAGHGHPRPGLATAVVCDHRNLHRGSHLARVPAGRSTRTVAAGAAGGCLGGQQLLNGNAQAIVVTLLALVPLHRRAGAVGLALATMLKLHPALAIAWYAGRRDWRALWWFAASCGLLLVVQLPWLGDFVRFYLHDTAAVDTIAGMSLRALGPVVWLAGVVIVGIVAVLAARGRWGWLLAILLQLVALPRVLLVNLALLLAAPLPSRRPTTRSDEAA